MTLHPILLVEDDADIAGVLGDVFEGRGDTMVHASHGQEALDFVDHGLRPRIILLDLMMPVMDGFEFLRRRLAHPVLDVVPVIVTTAQPSREPFGSHVHQVRLKPTRLPDLFAAIESAVRAT